MPNKITALMATYLVMFTNRLHPDPDQDREVGGIGEYAAVVTLGVAAAIGVFAVYQGWLDGVIGGLPTP